MTIRRQILLVVTLLFAGVGAVGSLLSWRLQTDALRLAFETQGRSLAAAIGEFVDAPEVAALRAGRDWTQTPLGAAWGRWQRWRTITRLLVLDPATGAVLADSAPGRDIPSPGGRRDLGPGEIRLEPYREASAGSYRLPLLVRAAGGRAVVGVEIDADEYFRQRREIVSRGEEHLIWAVVAGLAIGAILGGAVSRSIRRLSDAVETVGSPAFVLPGGESPIREVADLGAALGVMHSVLGGTLDKARRALVESDRFRTEAGLAGLWRGLLQPAAAGRAGGAEAAWFTVGAPPPPAFAGMAEIGPAAGAAFVGVAGAGEGVDAAVRAQAAGSYLADLLSRRPLDEAAAETRELFGLARLVAVRWSGGQLECWDDGAALESAAATWLGAAPLMLSGLGPRNRERARLYLAAFSRHPAAAMLGELPPLLDPAEPGIVLVLRRGQGDQPGAP